MNGVCSGRSVCTKFGLRACFCEEKVDQCKICCISADKCLPAQNITKVVVWSVVCCGVVYVNVYIGYCMCNTTFILNALGQIKPKVDISECGIVMWRQTRILWCFSGMSPNKPERSILPPLRSLHQEKRWTKNHEVLQHFLFLYLSYIFQTLSLPSIQRNNSFVLVGDLSCYSRFDSLCSHDN
jgi:hypothetical protein